MAGSTTIAVCTIAGEMDILNWLLVVNICKVNSTASWASAVQRQHHTDGQALYESAN